MIDLETIDGNHKVAAFLLSLDSKTATSVIKGMKPEAVTQVAEAMMNLDPRLSEQGAVDSLYLSIAQGLNGPTRVRPCDAGDLHTLLTQAFGSEQGDAVLQEIQERRLRERPFADLEVFSGVEIGRVLRMESNAVIAVVLAHIDPATTAGVLRSLEEETALDVMRRIAVLDPPAQPVLAAIAADLVEELRNMPTPSPNADPGERLKSIAEILSNSSPEMEKSVIETIAEEDTEMANELRELMFTWSDIATVDKRTMQKILGTVDTKTLAMALKGCTPEVEENVFGNLSARVRDMVAEERELTGAVPLSEVQGARDDVLNNIRAMIEAGEFRPSRGGDELVS